MRRTPLKAVKGALCLLLAALLGCAPAMAEASAWLNTDIVGTVTADTPEARPQDDFNLAMNRENILNLEIPDGYMGIGGLSSARYVVDQRHLEAILDQSLTGHDAELVHQYYNLLMDWDTRNALGVEPAMPYVNAMRAIDSLEDMTAWFADPDRGGLSAFEGNGGCLFSYGAGISSDDPTARVLSISPMSLSLGDAAEYKELSENGKAFKARMTARWSIVLDHLGFSEAEATQMIDNTFAFEALMAARQLDLEAKRDPANLSSFWNPTDLAGVEEMCGAFPVGEILKGWGADQANVYNVRQPEYMKALAGLYTEENLDLMRDWLTVRTVAAWPGYLDQATRDDTNAAEDAVTGVQGVEPDETLAMQHVYNDLPIPADNVYIAKYCTPQLRDDVRELIDAIIADYRKMLMEEDWLTEATRQKAIEKLDNIVIRCVYPDTLETWDGLEFPADGNLLEAYLATSRYARDRDLRRVNEPVDRNEWDRSMMPTSTTNAFYYPSDNSINIMAGILADCIYQDDYSYEEKLGTIGAIIGHEISHAFDPSGAQYDKDGRLESWWTDADKTAFDARAKKLVDYYDGLTVVDNIQYSGTLVQGEAVADMGGMKAVLHIAAGIEGFDYQKFFEAYSRIWNCVFVKFAEVYYAKVDPHPLCYLRINVTVSQFDEFQKAFDVQPGDGMYVAPEDRICVW